MVKKKNKQKLTISELKEAQKELIDSLIFDTDEIDKVLNVFQTKMASFHQYSIRNILLCEMQLVKKTEGYNHVELLGSYSQWKSVGRYVKAGSTSLQILRPYPVKNPKYDEDDPENDAEEFIIKYTTANTFDISQTDGEPLIIEKVTGGNVLFEDLVSNLDIEVIRTNDTLTRGWTDGEKIAVSSRLDNGNSCSTLFHELMHFYNDYERIDGEVRRIERPTHIKEIFAESGSYILSRYCGFDNEKAKVYIRNWSGDAKSVEGMGDEVLKLVFKLIDELCLDELLNKEVDTN